MTPENEAILKEELVRDEGIRLCPYRDTEGFWTIGIGHFIGRNKGSWGCISEERMWNIFEDDYAHHTAELDRHFPWWRDLSEVRQRVMVNMMFNMGAGTMLTFRNTMRAIREGRYEDAALGMCRSKWATQVKGRARRLAFMMRTDRTPAGTPRTCPT